MAEPREFKTTLKEIPVTIDEKAYVLKELDGLQKGKYLNVMGKRIVLNDQGKVKAFLDYSGLESTLLAVCLYDEEDNLMKIHEMEKWPSTVLSELFDMAQDLSALKEEARKRMAAEAKNS